MYKRPMIHSGYECDKYKSYKRFSESLNGYLESMEVYKGVYDPGDPKSIFPCLIPNKMLERLNVNKSCVGSLSLSLSFACGGMGHGS